MNPYKILGVRPNASDEEIRAAYDNLINTYSSQNFENSSEEFLVEDKLSEINDAFNAINNESKYKKIRSLIENEQFINAETELNLISDKNSPEWNYLKGFVMLKKGWFQSGISHLKTAAELNPSNPEYKSTLIQLSRKINEIKQNYARVAASKNSNNMNPCGGAGGNSMCGGPSGGSGDMSAIMNMLGGMNGMGGNVPNGNIPNGNATGNSSPQNNPLQNMLLQNLMSQGGNGMNMCGNSGGGGGMC